ncbi:Pr6Pr family membrane protein [Actinocorallia lasiicapitis]
MRNRGVAGAWWALVAVVVLLGEAASFLAHGYRSQLIFFTNQSNIYLGIVAAYTAWRLWSGRRVTPAPVLTSAILFILITGLVYNIVLAPDARPLEGLALFSDTALHKVTPVLGLLGWLFFAPHGGLRPIHAAIWLVYPLAYFAFVLIRGEILVTPAVRYPYPFLDVTSHGYGGVLWNAVVYAVFFWLLGLLLVFVDKLLAARAPALA